MKIKTFYLYFKFIIHLKNSVFVFRLIRNITHHTVDALCGL